MLARSWPNSFLVWSVTGESVDLSMRIRLLTRCLLLRYRYRAPKLLTPPTRDANWRISISLLRLPQRLLNNDVYFWEARLCMVSYHPALPTPSSTSSHICLFMNAHLFRKSSNPKKGWKYEKPFKKKKQPFVYSVSWFSFLRLKIPRAFQLLYWLYTPTTPWGPDEGAVRETDFRSVPVATFVLEWQFFSSELFCIYLAFCYFFISFSSSAQNSRSSPPIDGQPLTWYPLLSSLYFGS